MKVDLSRLYPQHLPAKDYPDIINRPPKFVTALLTLTYLVPNLVIALYLDIPYSNRVDVAGASFIVLPFLLLGPFVVIALLRRIRQVFDRYTMHAQARHFLYVCVGAVNLVCTTVTAFYIVSATSAALVHIAIITLTCLVEGLAFRQVIGKLSS